MFEIIAPSSKRGRTPLTLGKPAIKITRYKTVYTVYFYQEAIGYIKMAMGDGIRILKNSGTIYLHYLSQDEPDYKKFRSFKVIGAKAPALISYFSAKHNCIEGIFEILPLTKLPDINLYVYPLKPIKI